MAHKAEILDKYGVTHILNLALLVENIFAPRIIYKEIVFLDLPSSDALIHFSSAFRFIDEGRQSGGVLVHCNKGISRASTVVIGYLMKSEGMSMQLAYDHVKNCRPKACPNPGFIHQLQMYEERLKREQCNTLS